MSPPFVCIYASQVAACVGLNRYKPVGDAVQQVWQRLDHAGFRDALVRNQLRTPDERAQSILNDRAHLKACVEVAAAAPAAHTSAEAARRYAEAAAVLGSERNLAADDTNVIDEMLRQATYARYGTANESVALAYVRDTLGIACHQDPTFYKRMLGACHGDWPWYIGGRVDALSQDRTVLIEIKNRVNRLFYRAPAYENVQVQTYLHLLDMEQGLLVECLKSAPAEPDRRVAPGDAPGSAPGVATNVIPIKRDRLLWDATIAPRLQIFVDFVTDLLDDKELQDKFLGTKNKSAMLTARWKKAATEF